MHQSPKEFAEHLFSIFCLRSVILSALAVLCTFVSVKMNLIADFPLALLGTAVIFPIVFAINSAYQRRELALGHYAKIKANLRALYLGLSRWNGPITDTDRAELRQTVSRPIYAVRHLITNPQSELRDNEQHVYASFDQVSSLTEYHLTAKDIRGADSAACHNYLRDVMANFEELKHIYQYRTPRALQAFSDIFTTLLPLLYAPVFAAIALGMPNTPLLAYAIPALFAFVLCSLDNIQAALEDPFDGIGVDDIVISAERFEQTLTCAYSLPAVTHSAPIKEINGSDVPKPASPFLEDYAEQLNVEAA